MNSSQEYKRDQGWLSPFLARVRRDASLARMCWFQTGGAATYLFKPENTEDLKNFLQAKPPAMPIFVLGVGSNLLVRDGGFRGCIIRLGRSFNYINHEGYIVKVGAATLDLNLALYAAEHGIGGLEFFSGIPGTIGGALAMNAGAYGADTASVLLNATAIHANGALTELSCEDIGYHYRGNILGPDWIFLEGRFQGYAALPAQLLSNIQDIQTKRGDTQPIKERSSGSTFKNPEGHKAWQLIDQAGCRGLKIGGAMVSEMHCNFFLNTGDATSADIEMLIKEVQRRVYEHSGVLLETEIKIIGDAL